MSAIPICIICKVERNLISITPVKNRHEMRQYECPQCRNVFRLVSERKRPVLPEMISLRAEAKSA